MRLHELYPYVDMFVIAESPRTFTGEEKPLYFHENQDKFEKFWDKILHVVVQDDFDFDSPWDAEYHQRNGIKRGMEGAVDIEGDDIILVSDVDEIPHPMSLNRFLFERGKIHFFRQRYFNYDFSCEFDFSWYGTMAIHGDIIDQVDFNRLRKDKIRDKDKRVIRVPTEGTAGWHCSYFGGAENIIKKIEAFSHQEYNKPKYKNPDTINKLIDSKEDLFFRNYKMKANDVENDNGLPFYKDLAYGNV